MKQCSYCLETYSNPEPTINNDLSTSWFPEDFSCPNCGRSSKVKSRRDYCYCGGKIIIVNVKILHNVILAVKPQTVIQVIEKCEKCSEKTKSKTTSHTDIRYCVWPWSIVKKEALKQLNVEDRMFLTEYEIKAVFRYQEKENRYWKENQEETKCNCQLKK